jgi:hypothetical protein
MSDAVVTALGAAVDELRRSRPDARAYMCEGSDRDAVVWGPDELTIRLAGRGDDEIWVISGAGMLERLVADSEGNFDDLVGLVLALLDGSGREVLVPGHAQGTLVPGGWEVTVGLGGQFSGGLAAKDGTATVPLRGHLSHFAG